jgi:hypothetical protein
MTWAGMTWDSMTWAGTTWDSISQPGMAALAPLRIGQAYGVKLIELGVVNVNSTLEFVGELSSAKSPADFAEAVGNETRRRLETLTEQMEQLSRLFGARASEAAEVTGLGD